MKLTPFERSLTFAPRKQVFKTAANQTAAVTLNSHDTPPLPWAEEGNHDLLAVRRARIERLKTTSSNHQRLIIESACAQKS
jgi:hypothetical protein